MTKNHVIESFMRGELDRRGLITRLTAAGVSAGAAAAYATSLGGSRVFASSGSPVVVRHAQAQEDYGTAIELGSDAEGAEYLLEDISSVLAVLAGLDGFGPDDFDEGVYDILTTIQEQQEEHAAAISSLFDPPLDIPAGSAASFSSADEYLAALIDALDTLVATYAAVVPAIAGDEARQTLMEIALVAAGHLAVARQLAGENPFPGSFQAPSDPTE
jgi:hypothetical protein